MHASLYMTLGAVVSGFLGLIACAGWARISDSYDNIPGVVFWPVALFFAAILGAGAWWLTSIGWLTW